MLDAVLQYVEAVLDGKQEPDTSVGRALNDMVSGRVGLMNDEGLLGLVVYVLYFWKERSELDSGYTRLDDTMIFLLYCSFQDHASLQRLNFFFAFQWAKIHNFFF